MLNSFLIIFFAIIIGYFYKNVIYLFFKKKYDLWEEMPPKLKTLIVVMALWVILATVSLHNGFYTFLEVFIGTLLGMIYCVGSEDVATQYRFEVGKWYQTRESGSVMILRKYKMGMGRRGFLCQLSPGGSEYFVHLNGMVHDDGKSRTGYDILLGEVPPNYLNR